MTRSAGVAIIGGGGYGRGVLEYAPHAKAAGWGYTVAGFFDDSSSARDGDGRGFSLLGSLTDIDSSTVSHFIVAMGSPELRKRAADIVSKAGRSLLTLVHPRAYVSSSAMIDAGCVICPFAMVGAYSHVAENVSVNVYG